MQKFYVKREAEILVRYYGPQSAIIASQRAARAARVGDAKALKLWQLVGENIQYLL